MATGLQWVGGTVLYLFLVTIFMVNIGPYIADDGIGVSQTLDEDDIAGTGNETDFSQLQSESGTLTSFWDFLTFQISGVASLISFVFVYIPTFIGLGGGLLAFIRGGT